MNQPRSASLSGNCAGRGGAGLGLGTRQHAFFHTRPSLPRNSARAWHRSPLAVLALGVSCLAALRLIVPQVSACSVPVFRYALERWPAAPYQVWVLHRGPLPQAQQELLRRLSPSGSTNRAIANVVVHTVNLDAPPDAALQELGKRFKAEALPAMVLHYPAGGNAQGEAWAGPFNETTVSRLLDSPARRRIAQRLLRGDSAAWVLVESGDKMQDDTAAAALQSRLDRLQASLKLPKLDAEDIANRVISVAESELKVAFSLTRLSRTNAAEQVFLPMLLNSEEDLQELKEPIAFPIMGRGRALYALAGKGINQENIDEACAFLVGPCSCVVKEENPGFDLLLAADWDGLVSITATAEPSPPELTGLTSQSAPPSQSPSNGVSDQAQTHPPSAEAAGGLVPEAPQSHLLGRRVVLVGALGLALLAAGTWLVLRRRG